MELKLSAFSCPSDPMSWPTPGTETEAYGNDKKNPSPHPAGHRRKQMWELANVEMSLGSQGEDERQSGPWEVQS